MGLCKCPKKKVTNLFCFEHRVNVCEHCLVSNHPKCIVQSYLQWLQDSDYDPTCRLCGKRLSGDDVGDCVRLVCYDVFHWSCLDHYARQLPANTAPAGYSCPICKSGVFPAHNVASPVAEALREILIKVNWARVGLGLPLIEEPPPDKTGSHTGAATVAGAGHQIQATGDIPLTHTHANTSSTNLAAMDSQSLTNATRAPVYTPGGSNVRTPVAPPAVYGANIPDSIISMENAAPYARIADSGHPGDPRKLFDSTKGADHMNMSHDHDEDKYKRRSALQWFARWFSSRNPKQRKDPNATCKRFAIIIVISLIGFFTVIVIFSKLGRAATDNDPFLDPMANPNIQVKDTE